MLKEIVAENASVVGKGAYPDSRTAHTPQAKP